MSNLSPINKIPLKQLPDKKIPKVFQPKNSSSKVYTRRIHGFYQRLRRRVSAPLLLAFFVLPWISIDQRPAIFLDIAARKFHIFWLTFWPQDGLLLAWLLIISAFLLFAVTVWVGRVWCGFSCPQTIWTQMFIWIEDKCEGDRQSRMKLDAKAWDANKALRKTSKHILWWLLAFFTSATFVGYFYDIRELISDIFLIEVTSDAVFWTGFFTLATYINAGWMREQVCKHMCPYARFQSVMYDKGTKVVSYDANRGDSFVDAVSGISLNKNIPQNNNSVSIKRLPRSAALDHNAAGLGDCIDCSWCVQVCPVDIDIRGGLQADCINCGLCVDACDSIMDKINYPRGLIRFASETELENKKSSDNKIRLPSPRFIGYSLVLLIITGLFVTQLISRTPLEAGIARDRGVNLYRERGENIENVYLLRLGNMSRKAQNYQVSVLPPYYLKGRREIFLEEGEIFSLPLRVAINKAEVRQAKQTITFRIASLSDSSIAVDKTSSFISPSSLLKNRNQ